MHINQLVDILTFINKVIEQNDLLGKYKYLLNLAASPTINKDEIIKNQLIESKNQLATLLIDLDPKKWGEATYKIYIKYEKFDLLGEEAALKLNKIIDDHADNLKLVVPLLDEIIASFNSLLASTKQLLSGLDPLTKPGLKSAANAEIEERHHLLYIQFDEAIFIKNIGQLEKFCRIWNRILASFAVLTREPADEIRIHDIESTSITFYTGIKTINALTKGSYQVLKGYKKVLEVRRLQLELDGLSLNYKDEIKNLLEEEVVNIVDVISDSIAGELTKKFEWEGQFEFDDIKASIQVSLKQTLNFIEKGGRISSHHTKDLQDLNSRVVTILKNISEMENNQILRENANLDQLIELN